MPKILWDMRFGKKSKAGFNNVPMTAFNNTILFTSMGTREAMGDAKSGKER